LLQSGGYVECSAHQASRIFGLGIGENIGDRALFDDPAVLHHHDAMAEGAND